MHKQVKLNKQNLSFYISTKALHECTQILYKPDIPRSLNKKNYVLQNIKKSYLIATKAMITLVNTNFGAMIVRDSKEILGH